MHLSAYAKGVYGEGLFQAFLSLLRDRVGFLHSTNRHQGHYSRAGICAHTPRCIQGLKSWTCDGWWLYIIDRITCVFHKRCVQGCVRDFPCQPHHVAVLVYFAAVSRKRTRACALVSSSSLKYMSNNWKCNNHGLAIMEKACFDLGDSGGTNCLQRSDGHSRKLTLGAPCVALVCVIQCVAPLCNRPFSTWTCCNFHFMTTIRPRSNPTTGPVHFARSARPQMAPLYLV